MVAERICLVILTATGLVALVWWLSRIMRFVPNTLDEILPLIQTTSLQQKIADLGTEDPVLAIVHRDENRRQARLKLELLRRVCHQVLANAAVIARPVAREIKITVQRQLEAPSTLIDSMHEIVTSKRQVQAGARVCLLRIWFWNLTRFDILTFLPIPDIKHVRTVRGRDVIESYQHLVQGLIRVSGFYGEAGEQMGELLRKTI